MNRFICPVCGRNQYTSCDKADTCVYCGNLALVKAETLETNQESEPEGNETETRGKSRDHRAI
jgi:hypothetical protein